MKEPPIRPKRITASDIARIKLDKARRHEPIAIVETITETTLTRDKATKRLETKRTVTLHFQCIAEAKAWVRRVYHVDPKMIRDKNLTLDIEDPELTRIILQFLGDETP